MGSPKIILLFAVSLTCEHFGLTEYSSFGVLRRIIGSVQFIVRNGVHGSFRTGLTNRLCHLNGCSNINAELTCSLVHVQIATFVVEIDISSIIHREHVNLNAAYVLSRTYRIRIQDVRRNQERHTSVPVTWPSTVYPLPRGIATNSRGQVVVYMLFY